LKKVCILLIFLIPSFAYAQTPRWPLDIEISPSSSFAEFRGLRFHGGVDLRTQQRTGFPVYAVADGFVSRIKVQHRGFGYALYIDHPALNIRSVFGHLEDYAEPMAAYVREKQKKMGKLYGIDDSFSAERFSIKRGQIIGYTGESGIGPPHLHFELRKFNDNPISPTSVGMIIPDKIPPKLLSVYFEGLASDSLINGGFDRAAIPLKMIKPNIYSWDKPVIVSGKVGLKIGLIDTNGSGNRFGVEKIDLFLDDKILLRRVFQEYSYDENWQCTYAYDYFLSSLRGTGYVYTLFKWPAETLCYSREFPPWAGILCDELPGKHNIRIEAIDFGGNKVIAKGQVVILNPSTLSRSFCGQLTFRNLRYNAFSVVSECDCSSKEAIVKGSFDSVKCKDAQGCEHILPASIENGRVRIAFPINKIWASGAQVDGCWILPRQSLISLEGGELHGDSEVKVVFPKNCMDFPFFADLIRRSSRLKQYGSDKQQLIARSSVWDLIPSSLILPRPMEIEFELPVASNPRQLGIYEESASGRYSYCGGEIKECKIACSARTTGAFVILEDKISPTCSYKGKRNIKHLGSCYVYEANDVGEGLDFDAIRAWVDGKAVLVDSDPDKDEIYVTFSGKTGKKNILLKIFDCAGNVEEIREKR